MLALRVGRRRTAWESNNIDTIIKNEFQSRGELELDASVYLIEEAQTKQAVAEHCASNALGVRGFANIDLLTDRELVNSPGETRFAFTRAVHRELRFRPPWMNVSVDFGRELKPTRSVGAALPQSRERRAWQSAR